MSILGMFQKSDSKEKSDAVEKLIATSSPRPSFFTMIILSVMMATLGLIMNDIAVIIGSMLIAPMLYPILSLSMGIVMMDAKLIFRAILTFLISVVYGLIGAIVFTLIFASKTFEYTEQILSRIEPSIMHLTVAVVAGMGASFALVKPRLSENLPGVAISVALVPPIAVIGIGLARLDYEIALGALELFLLNTVGIVFASLLVFTVMKFSVKKKVAEEAIKKEEKDMEKTKSE